MMAEPVLSPVTIPKREPIVATAVLSLVHVPPPVASCSVVVWPMQTKGIPVIAGGSGKMVTVVVTTHPEPGKE